MAGTWDSSSCTRKLDIEIIGVIENIIYSGPREGERRQVFVAEPQESRLNGETFYVRTNLDSKQMFGAINNAVKKLDPRMAAYEMRTLESQLDQTLLTERLIAMMSAGFGALATLLASIGLYGVMAFVVARRTKEIGVRLALGAMRGSVVWLVMREVLLLLGRRPRRGNPSGARAGPLHFGAALRRQGERSLGRRHCGDSAVSYSSDGRVGSGPAGQPHRPACRPALRMISS